MDLMIWLSKQPVETLYIAAIALAPVIMCLLTITMVLLARPKHKEKHISGFANRKAKKGELKK